MISKIFSSITHIFSAIITSLSNALADAPPEIRKIARRLLLGALIILLLVSGVKWGFLKAEEKARAAELAAGPRVKVAKIIPSPAVHTITQIGETRPYQEATLYAKVSGYLKDVKVDKGDIVKSGDTLAIIESPETDQAYVAALADDKNKRAIAERMRVLLAKHLVSQQEADQARADADVSRARLHTQEILKGYEFVRAPFDGKITARFADPGALVQNATNSQSSALPVVTISDVNRLRVDVFVDQHDAPFVAKDDPVEISMSERPGVKISGMVSRVSGELDPKTKMLLTEIDLPNDQHEVVAGSFVQVALKIKSPPALEAPVESLLVKDNKSYITTVGEGNLVAWKQVNILYNDGKMLWISSGVKEEDIVALNIADTVPEGGKVRPIEEAAAGATK